MTATTTTPADVILDWWSFVAFAGSLVIGFLLGTAKQRWTQEQLQLRIAALEGKLTALERTIDTDSRAVLLLGNEFVHIRVALNEIKAKLEA